MIIASWTVAESLPGKHRLWGYRLWYLHIWKPALYRFSGIHRVRAWHQALRHAWLPRGWRSLTGSTVRTLWGSLSKPTWNQSLSMLLHILGENTGGTQFYTKAIESSERVSGRPARSSTNICQRGGIAVISGSDSGIATAREAAQPNLLPQKAPAHPPVQWSTLGRREERQGYCWYAPCRRPSTFQWQLNWFRSAREPDRGRGNKAPFLCRGNGAWPATPRWSSFRNEKMTHPRTPPQRVYCPGTWGSNRDHHPAPGNDCIQ